TRTHSWCSRSLAREAAPDRPLATGARSSFLQQAECLFHRKAQGARVVTVQTQPRTQLGDDRPQSGDDLSYRLGAELAAFTTLAMGEFVGPSLVGGLMQLL